MIRQGDVTVEHSGGRVVMSWDTDGAASACLGWVSGRLVSLRVDPTAATAIRLVDEWGVDLLSTAADEETTILLAGVGPDGERIPMLHSGRLGASLSGAGSGTLELHVEPTAVAVQVVDWETDAYGSLPHPIRVPALGRIVRAVAVPSVGMPPAGAYALTLLDPLTACDALYQRLSECPADVPESAWYSSDAVPGGPLELHVAGLSARAAGSLKILWK